MNNKSNKTPKFIFEDKLNGREKELTPMLLKTIEYKEKKQVALSKAVDKVLVNYPGVHLKYLGCCKDKNGKRFPTYHVGSIPIPPKVEPVKKLAGKPVNAPKKEFYVGEVRGVRYVWKNNSACRNVVYDAVFADDDLSARPDLRDKRLCEAEETIKREGFYLHEDEALADVAHKVASQLSKLGHELRYSESGPCRRCTRNRIECCKELLETAIDGYARGQSLSIDYADKLKEVVAVWPNEDVMDEYDVVDGHFVRVKDRELKDHNYGGLHLHQITIHVPKHSK